MTISVSHKAGIPAEASVQTTKPNNADVKETCTLLPNRIDSKLMSAYHKTTSAFTEYPAKGLKGSKKSNFYEFLAMGTVPYLVGSAMLMAVFNGASHLFDNASAKAAKSLGNKMALGVVFYGIAKSLSKKLISVPVKIATGIDTEMAYQRELSTDKDAPIQVHEIEQHKVMESHDFPRYDMMYGEKLTKDKKHPLPHNYLFDKIAKKNGLGEDLPASDTEVKPLIKDVISRSSTAKSLSSYLWAATGVLLAVQKPWNNFFRAASKDSWQRAKKVNTDAGTGIKGSLSLYSKNLMAKAVNTGENLYRISKSFGRSLVDSAKDLYNGPANAKGFSKHAGKTILGIAALSSILGVINTIHGARTAVGQEKNVFDNKGKITVQ